MKVRTQLDKASDLEDEEQNILTYEVYMHSSFD